MKLYIGLAAYVLVIVYLPIVLIGLAILFAKTMQWKTRAWAIPLYLLLAYAIPLGDVTWHSWNMNKTCKNAGLHVYRTVVVDGFKGWSERYIDKYGYRFMEMDYAFQEPSGLVIRWEKTASGVQKLDKVPPISEWALITDISRPDRELGMNKKHDFVRNRMTGELIAETWSFSAWRGWLDRWIGAVIDNGVGGCDGGSRSLYEYLGEILIPSKRSLRNPS